MFCKHSSASVNKTANFNEGGDRERGILGGGGERIGCYGCVHKLLVKVSINVYIHKVASHLHHECLCSIRYKNYTLVALLYCKKKTKIKNHTILKCYPP